MSRTVEGHEELDFVDLSQWPVAIIQFPEIEEPNRVQRFANSFDRLLARGEPFAVVWKMARHLPDQEPEEDEKAAHLWLKRVRKDVNRLVQGYSYVAPNDEAYSKLEGRLAQTASKLFAFPLHLTMDEQEAIRQGHKWMHAD